MKVHNFFKALCFTALLVCAVGYSIHCCSFPKSHISRGFESFYDEPEDTVDGVVFGTSVVAYGWNAPTAWHEYGMPVYQLGSTIQPFGALPELIEFVRSRQDIKYIVVDIHGLRSDAIMRSVLQHNILRLTTSLHFGMDRYRVRRAALDYAEQVYAFYGLPEDDRTARKKDISNYIPFLNLHNRWVDGLEKADFVNMPNAYKGAMDEKNTFKTKDMTDLSHRLENLSPGKINDFQKEMLDSFFDYLQQTELDVLFINYPSFYNEERSGELKSLTRYIQDNNYPMLDLCSLEMFDEIGLDISTDFVNQSHLNSIGACKTTRYICSYLSEHYYYKDHRGEAGYESWDKAVEDYRKFLKRKWKKRGREFNLL